MTLSVSDFQDATAYPCGTDKKACRNLLKEIPELAGVKNYSELKGRLKKASKSSSVKSGEKVLG